VFTAARSTTGYQLSSLRLEPNNETI
jgi:hypothetical protein